MASVDISNCDREVIHSPEQIQPHGVMLVLRPFDLGIMQASENAESMFGVEAASLPSLTLREVLGSELSSELRNALLKAGDRLLRGPTHLLKLALPGRRGFADAFAYRARDSVILELEYISVAPIRPEALYAELADHMSHLHSAENLQDFLERAAHLVYGLSGFDRVMIYRFAQDCSGEVLAESVHDGLTSYLGQHFPASDIPAPARALFMLSWLRHLPDVHYTPVRMVPERVTAVDMSRSLLRHVSVMYTAYLKNMGVHATMVMPLINNGKLWGLVSCMHHACTLHVPHGTRMAVELVAHMISSLISEYEERDSADYRNSMAAAIAGLGMQMASETDYRHGLYRGDRSLLGWLDATGAALISEDDTILLGNTPTKAQLRDLVSWLFEQDDPDAVFSTDQLSELYPPAAAFGTVATGVLAVRVMPGRPEILMWFRSEVLQTMCWAGDPGKPVEVDARNGEIQLSPRRSFALWRESVSGRSAPWLPCERDAAVALRGVVARMLLTRLNLELQRSNAELDSFTYIASHDLKEPLRGIHNFANFLELEAGPRLTGEECGRIQTIKRLSHRMDELTDALLQYSRVGRTELVLESTDVNELLREAEEQLASRIIETGTTISGRGQLPRIWTNRILLVEVLTNLVNNGLKYNDRPAGDRWIEIGCKDECGQRVFFVADNGIGIARKNLEHVFLIFRRLHGREEYGGGNGAGLTIARRAIERLGGRLWAESDGLGAGTTFRFSLGKHHPDQ